jgi:hypothetical protein
MKPLLCLAALVVPWAGYAQSFDLPSIKAGDTWKYRDTVEKGPNGWSQTEDEIAVSRVTATSIHYSARQSGSTQAARALIAGRDWSRLRDVNGKETLVNRPLSFPLAPGKIWEVEYRAEHPNKERRFEQVYSKFTVVGVEWIEVRAGKFSALKIEAEGHWSAEMEPSPVVIQSAKTADGGSATVSQLQTSTAAPATGRISKAFWNAPEVKRWVKSVEESYGNGGMRSERYTAELESFTSSSN